MKNPFFCKQFFSCFYIGKVFLYHMPNKHGRGFVGSVVFSQAANFKNTLCSECLLFSLRCHVNSENLLTNFLSLTTNSILK